MAEGIGSGVAESIGIARPADADRIEDVEGLADPQVGPVFSAMDDVAVKLTPSRWISWDMGELDRPVFGGAMSAGGYIKEVER